MPEVLAAIRPGEQDFALLLHLVGATVAFGAIVASATCVVRSRGDLRLLRLGYFSLLYVALPGWILMRLAGQWLFNLQHWDTVEGQVGQQAWLTIGFIVADWGGILFLVALALGGVGIARLRRGEEGAGLLRAMTIIALILAVAYAVAVWAMTGKPS